MRKIGEHTYETGGFLTRVLKGIGKDCTGRTLGSYKFRIIRIMPWEFDIFGDAEGEYFIMEHNYVEHEKTSSGVAYNVNVTERKLMARLC